MSNRTSFPNEKRLCIVALALGMACSQNDHAAADSSIPSDTLASTAVAQSDTGCPKSGPWRACSVLDRLEAAGLVVTEQSEPARLPFLSVEGTTYSTTRSTIHVFLYRDMAARRRDTDALDSVAVAPRNENYSWPEQAVLVTSNNLAAIVLSPNERQMERIVLALSAGLPAARR